MPTREQVIDYLAGLKIHEVFEIATTAVNRIVSAEGPICVTTGYDIILRDVPKPSRLRVVQAIRHANPEWSMQDALKVVNDRGVALKVEHFYEPDDVEKMAEVFRGAGATVDVVTRYREEERPPLPPVGFQVGPTA